MNEIAKKNNINYWKNKGIKVLDHIPNGWQLVKNATTQPNGYNWYSNSKSLFGSEREHCLVKNKDLIEKD